MNEQLHPDEVRIDDDAVARLVASQFPAWSGRTLRRLPPIGTDNLLFRLGEDLLVRLPRAPWAAESATWDHTWLPRIAAHLSLPVPAPVGYGEPGEGYPWHWTVVPWIEGENPDPTSFDPEEWAVSLAGFVRELRQVPALDGPVVTEGRGAPLSALDDWVREWTAKADEDQISRDAVLALWHDALDAPQWAGEPCWFHGDLHEGNLLVDGGRLAAVIDWGTAGRGDPAIELNATWAYLPDGVGELYRSEVGLDDAAYRRARGFALAPAISASTYYAETRPEVAQGALGTVRRLLASMDAD